MQFSIACLISCSAELLHDGKPAKLPKTAGEAFLHKSLYKIKTEDIMDQQVDVLKLDNQLCFPLYVCSKEIVKKYKPFLDVAELHRILHKEMESISSHE